MPSFLTKHSSESAPPVVIAILGISPSALLRGRRVSSAATGEDEHCATAGTITFLRQRPIWTTKGNSAPPGTSFRTKSPFASVSAVAIGLPDGVVPHLSQVVPSAKGSSSALGT